MDKLQLQVIIIILVYLVTIGTGTGIATGEGEAADHVVNTDNTPTEKEQKTPSSWDILKSAFTPAVYTSSSGGYFGKLRASLNRAYLFLFPPNIDFRGSKKEGEGEAAVEVSARKAAELTAEAAHKLKNTLSDSHDL